MSSDIKRRAVVFAYHNVGVRCLRVLAALLVASGRAAGGIDLPIQVSRRLEFARGAELRRGRRD